MRPASVIWLCYRKEIFLFLLGFLLRAILIVSNPIIWGGDTVIRLFHPFSVVTAHQLPALQALIAGLSLISTDPALVRNMMAVIGAVAGVAFYWVAADLFGEKWAFPGALLFITHPYILAVSTVPFQEILMLAGLLLAFHFFYTGQWTAASVCLGIACLTRYEAWAACPVLAVAYILRTDRSLTGIVKSGLLFAWAPLIWILANQGLTQRGHYVIERPVSMWRLQREVYLGWITVKFSQLPVLVLAGAGAWRLYRDRNLFEWRMRVQIAFLALFAIAILFSAHGVMPDPERYVTSREAHIPMYFVLLLSAAGLAEWPRWKPAIVASSMGLGVGVALWYIHTETVLADVQLDYRVAQYLNQSVRTGERALLLTKPLTAELTEPYLNMVRKTGTAEDVRQAEGEIATAALTPPDYQRVVVHTRLDRSQLLAAPAACADWVVVWNEYPEAARELTGATPVRVLRSGPLSANILRRQCGKQ